MESQGEKYSIQHSLQGKYGSSLFNGCTLHFFLTFTLHLFQVDSICLLSIHVNSSIHTFSLIPLLCWNVHCLLMSVHHSRIQLKDHSPPITLLKRSFQFFSVSLPSCLLSPFFYFPLPSSLVLCQNQCHKSVLFLGITLSSFTYCAVGNCLKILKC